MFPLSEMSLPFYLTHCQILIALASPLSWYPYISNQKHLLKVVVHYFIKSYRILSERAPSDHRSHTGGVLRDHKVWTSQIFLWSAHSLLLTAAWLPPRRTHTDIRHGRLVRHRKSCCKFLVKKIQFVLEVRFGSLVIQ